MSYFYTYLLGTPFMTLHEHIFHPLAFSPFRAYMDLWKKRRERKISRRFYHQEYTGGFIWWKKEYYSHHLNENNPWRWR
jgi:hypothetical protein